MKISIPLDMSRVGTATYSNKPMACDACGGSTYTLIHFTRYPKRDREMHVCFDCSRNHEEFKLLEAASAERQ